LVQPISYSEQVVPLLVFVIFVAVVLVSVAFGIVDIGTSVVVAAAQWRCQSLQSG
jgi:hypothetical protein